MTWLKKASKTTSTPSNPDPKKIYVEGALRDAVHALAAGTELLTSAWPDEEDVEWPVYDSGLQLARHVVDAALATPDALTDDALARQAHAHFARVMELAGEYEVTPFSLAEYEPDDDALGRAGEVLREQALEHPGVEFLVGTDKTTGSRVMVSAPVSVEQAHIWLSGVLYEKVEQWVMGDPLTILERIACGWWMTRWRGPRPLPGDEFARGVREQEFALVERPLRSVGDTPVEYLLSEGLLRRIGPRQRHMAAQLLKSVAGVWLVESRGEGEAVFVEPLSGSRLRVREHATTADNPYAAGYIAVGRLIPFGDGTWLRSPGSFLMSCGDRSAELARSLAEGLRSQIEHLPGPAILEAAVHALYGIRGLPRDVPPARTPDEAADVARDLTSLLREAEIARPVDPQSEPARRLARGGDVEVLEYDVDLVLGEFINALFEQSQKSRVVRVARRRRERQARKKKGRGRR